MRGLCMLMLVVALGGGCDDDSTPLDASTKDLAAPDFSTPDLATPDLSMPDLATPDLTPNFDLTMPDLKTCTANQFVECAGQMALYCNGTGDGVVMVDCGSAGCTGPSSCGQCTPSTVTCTGGQQTTCDDKGRATVITCGLGCNGGGTGCTTCTPAATSCSGQMLTTCNADGISTTTVTCALGCIDAAGATPAHCENLTPANGLTADCAAKSATLAIDLSTGDASIDPTTGDFNGTVYTAPTFTTVTRSGAKIGVFHVKSLAIAAGRTLKVRCPGAQSDASKMASLALVVDGDVTINGAIDNAGHLGAGATSATSGCGTANPDGPGGGGSAISDSQSGVGSGGGGYGGYGGNGGTPLLFTAYGAGGQTSGDVTVDPLLAGAAGGAYSGAVTDPAAGGGGGIQIVACGNVTVGAGGLVNVGGSGAPKILSSTLAGGSGGGSGGAILIEAGLGVSVSGLLAANGGGGGGGAIGGTVNLIGNAGDDAATDAACTGGLGGAGAVSGLEQGGAGGNGACGANTDGDTGGIGVPGTDKVTHGGGGGGGGRVRVNVPTGKTATVGMSNVSPAGLYTSGTLATK